MMEQHRGHCGEMIEFKRLSPLVFEGTIEPMEAEKWIIEMEKVFRFLECSEGEKVAYAAYMLRGDAYDWWWLEEENVAKRLSLGLGSYLSLYSMRNIFLRASIFRRKKSLSS